MEIGPQLKRKGAIPAIIAFAAELIAYPTITPATMNGHIGSTFRFDISSYTPHFATGPLTKFAWELLWQKRHLNGDERMCCVLKLVRYDVAMNEELV